jgi:hypothetical protein
MRAPILLLAFICPCLLGQTVGESAEAKQETLTPALPTAKVSFSDPDLNHPIQLASALLGGPPECGPDGRIFFNFRVPPPMYNLSIIESVSPADGKTADYPVERIVGLTKTVLDTYDPGVSAVSMILDAVPAGHPQASSSGFYLALYSYDGELEDYSRLDLGFEPVRIAQLTDDSFLVAGFDPAEGRSHFVLIDSRGKYLRDLDAGSIMPSGQQLKTMMGAMNFAGPKPEDFPPAMRTGMVLSLFRYVHSNRGLLLLEPGAEARVVELLRTGEVRTVRLKLPKGQVADSIVVGRGKWYVRAFLEGTDDQYSLYEVDPETGDATARVDTSGVPPGSIACSHDAGFSAVRRIDENFYLLFGDLR